MTYVISLFIAAIINDYWTCRIHWLFSDHAQYTDIVLIMLSTLTCLIMLSTLTLFWLCSVHWHVWSCSVHWHCSDYARYIDIVLIMLSTLTLFWACSVHWHCFEHYSKCDLWDAVSNILSNEHYICTFSFRHTL